LRIANRLSSIELENSATGHKVALGTYWEAKTTVLIFLRHFG